MARNYEIPPPTTQRLMSYLLNNAAAGKIIPNVLFMPQSHRIYSSVFFNKQGCK